MTPGAFAFGILYDVGAAETDGADSDLVIEPNATAVSAAVGTDGRARLVGRTSPPESKIIFLDK